MRSLTQFSLPVLLVLSLSSIAKAQDIFSHNDYHSKRPLYGAFEIGAVYIECDVFLKDGQLLVGHTLAELQTSKTIEAMYLQPIAELAKQGKLNRKLVLMVDLKTKGTPTLQSLVEKLQQFPELTTHASFRTTISGNYPPPQEWSGFPTFIYFDGRPGIDYTQDQLDRITLISSSFKDWSSWKGKGELSAKDETKLHRVIEEVHQKGKPVRFWASPDSPDAWKRYIELSIDIINTDHPAEVAAFLKK